MTVTSTVCAHRLLDLVNWVCVFRGSTGDFIFVNGSQRAALEQRFVVPPLLVSYREPFTRADRLYSFFLTTRGDQVTLDGAIFPSVFDGDGRFAPFWQPNGVWLVAESPAGIRDSAGAL